MVATSSPPGRSSVQPLTLLGRLASIVLVLVMSLSLVACSGDQSSKPPSISPEDMATITRQAEGFLDARNELPELAGLVNSRNWVFTRNLIHGPMQEVGRQMSYINRLLLPADRAEANKRADSLKTSLAQLDEAARLQDGDRLRDGYIKVARDFGLYAQLLPEEVQVALKQI